jgi:hypothetical protein
VGQMGRRILILMILMSKQKSSKMLNQKCSETLKEYCSDT